METITRVIAEAIVALASSKSIKPIPRQAKYLAQDTDGRWWGYIDRPRLDEERGTWLVLNKARCEVNFFILTESAAQVATPQQLYKIL